MHAQERAENTSDDFEVLSKWDGKAKVEMSYAWLSVEDVPQQAYRATQQRLGDLLVPVFKKISVQSSADHWVSRDFSGHIPEEYKLYRINLEKSLNK